jgi:NAD(P)-dependent dehydrogenase (short-subunit alcohol dehydrogenase family)
MGASFYTKPKLTRPPRQEMLPDMGDFENRVVVVTGAARGIGREIAQSFAAEGARLAIADLDEEGLELARGELESGGSETLSSVCDVGSEQGANALVDATVSAFGHIDILVNNAGHWIIKSVENTTTEEWDLQISTNLRSLYLLCRRAIPALREGRDSSVINLASMAAMRFTVPHVAYASSKAGVVAFTRDLAVELAPDRIRVNAIAPGPIDTSGFVHAMNPEERERYLGNLLLGRVGTPRDIANAALFLASERASYITGVTLPVTGGGELRIPSVM